MRKEIKVNSAIEYYQNEILNTNFFQIIDEFLYLNSKAVKFFQIRIIPKKTLLSILSIIWLAIEKNYLNLVILFNLSSKNFVTTFRCLGSTYYNFVILISKMAFSANYFFSNLLFIRNVLSLTLDLRNVANKRMSKEPKDLSDEMLMDQEDTKENRDFRDLEKNDIEEGLRNIDFLDKYCDYLDYVRR